MTPGEIFGYAQMAQEEKLESYRVLAAFLYTAASLISIGINDPQKFPAKEEAFPGLFEEQAAQQDWRVMKARVEEYARAKNT